ncbi:hypothetical protein ACHAQH_002152 [Verticillium albo-atrum]
MSIPLSDLHSTGRPIPQRQSRGQTIQDNLLAHLSDAQLEEDARRFITDFLFVDIKELLRAICVARDPRIYEAAARSTDPEASHALPVQLRDDEKKALRRERDVPLGERGVWTIIATVSLAAFLQGHVQSSFNGGALYDGVFGLHTAGDSDDREDTSTKLDFTGDDWKLGAANASPFLFAALLGCPLALPVNHYLGRKGGVAIAAFLIFVTSIASAFATTWYHLFGIRLINGIGMGLKAVSTPILASETAVGFWRGTSILAWQLWVACGIAIGFAFNLIFSTAKTDETTFALIMAAPAVPSLALFILVIWFCDESPRYLLRKSSPNYNPKRAYAIIRKLRSTELQALRDIYLLQKSIDKGEPSVDIDHERNISETFINFLRQYRQLFRVRRLRNALVSSSIVNLSQQLCGINVLAFYSGTLFSRAGTDRATAMQYSLGIGAVNFVFCLPAIRTIDTLGRRKWLNLTLPLMAALMAAAALSFRAPDGTRVPLVTVWLFLFAAAYSPGLGPIPFTYASESFPLSHREAGAAFAIAVNLGFGGLLSMFYPRINSSLEDAGALGLFSGLNIVAFVLVFFLLEETKRRSLEDLDTVFEHSKMSFARHQARRLKWFFRRWVLWREEEKPSIGYHPEEPKPGPEALQSSTRMDGEIEEVEASDETRRREIGDLHW